MGTIFKKSATKPLPAGARIIVRKGQRLAEWKDAKGKTRTAPVITGRDGTDRIVVTDLEKRAEKVGGGLLTPAEDAAIDHQNTPIGEHVAAFIAHQKAKGLNPVGVKNSENRLARLTGECGFRCLSGVTAAALERWLADRQAERMSAGTRNEYRQELVGFGNWCVRTRRLLTNPFAVVAKADTKADCRRKRRALTEAELTALLAVARRRPLVEAMTVRRGWHQGEAIGTLREPTRRRLTAR